MAKRKLPVVALVMALLSLAAVPAGLACKRHYRRAAVHHHRVVHHHHYVAAACRRRHYRTYGTYAAKPYFVSLATATPMAALDLTPPPRPERPVIPEYVPPSPPEAAPPVTACCQPNPCCNGGGHHHHRY